MKLYKPKRPGGLTNKRIAALVEAGNAGRWGDKRGHGLILNIKETSDGRVSASWIQRIAHKGRVYQRGLGPLWEVALAQARQKAAENWLRIKGGDNPFQSVSKAPTFAECAEQVIVHNRPEWRGPKSEADWRAMCKTYFSPKLGKRRVDTITTADLLDVVRPMTSGTAKKARQRLGAVMKWVVAHGHRKDNPADYLATVLPKKNGDRTKHRKALPHVEVASAVQVFRGVAQWVGARLAVEFLVLTAARSGEVRGMTWDEVDGDTWTVPAERMKAKVEHRVPLSDQAMAVLKQARTLTRGRGTDLVFPAAGGKQMYEQILTRVLKPLKGRCDIHGFRSSFRDWCGETGQPREVAEACLAHKVGNAVEQAYSRSDLINRRREVMQQWADYLSQ